MRQRPLRPGSKSTGLSHSLPREGKILTPLLRQRPPLHRTGAFTLAIWSLVMLTSTAGTPAAVQPDYSPPPGAVNPQVTQANIAQTICRRGWTRSIRPPASYTDLLKRKQLRARHLPGKSVDYDEDHLIPLELGGHPTDPRNLWPQPWPQARLKDKWESGYNRAVCAGRVTLTIAQQRIKDPGTWR